MFARITLLSFALMLLVPFILAADSDVYNRIGIVKGQVIIVNHPDLGCTPASGHYFVFQHVDCKSCLIGVRTDIEGKYTLFLGVGKYRVISYDSESRKDLIRKGSTREVKVRSRPDDTVFDIELEIPTR